MNSSTQVLNGGVFTDDRGRIRFVNDFDFNDVKRFYQVENHRQGYIRAWHGHVNEGKYVYVAKGSALIGAVPMDDQSAEHQMFIVYEHNPKVLCIHPKYANGFNRSNNQK